MNSKKTLSVVIIASALVLVFGVAGAATTKNPQNTKPQGLTSEQQTCVKDATKDQQATIKAAQDAFNEATKDALAEKQAAIKAAQDAFNEATKDALAEKQAAIKAAQAIKDAKEKSNAIKTANDAFNNNEIVKPAKVILQDAIKAANDAYNNDSSVKNAKPSLDAVMKASSEKIAKKCGLPQNSVKKSAGDNTNRSLWQSIKDLFHRTTSALMNAFSFKIK